MAIEIFDMRASIYLPAEPRFWLALSTNALMRPKKDDLSKKIEAAHVPLFRGIEHGFA